MFDFCFNQCCKIYVLHNLRFFMNEGSFTICRPLLRLNTMVCRESFNTGIRVHNHSLVFGNFLSVAVNDSRYMTATYPFHILAIFFLLFIHLTFQSSFPVPIIYSRKNLFPCFVAIFLYSHNCKQTFLPLFRNV